MAQKDDIETTRVAVASKAELEAAIAQYTVEGFQLKAVSDTTASLERIQNAYKTWLAVLLYMCCIIPGFIYSMKNPPNKRVGEVILIQVDAAAHQTQAMDAEAGAG